MKIFDLFKKIFQKLFSASSSSPMPHEAEVQGSTSEVEPDFDNALQHTISEFRRLQKRDNAYYFTEKRQFVRKGKLKAETIEKVFNFAYEMAFTDKHRNTRSGGSKGRTNGEIFANTFQGKIAECAACNFFFQYDRSAVPDFGTYEKGVWDSVDVTVCGKQIAVKSTKHFGQLLLLETKDWDIYGRYIPNIGTATSAYDYLMLVRITPSCEDLLRQERLLYCNQIDRNRLHQICCNQKWEYDYAGYITQDDLIYIIRNGYILPKNSLLNGKTPMDAENFYVQAADLHNIESIKEFFV